ncbi:hypothetical protein [Arsenophonus endosymbiont of Aphis craccivora]|uniref:hypothetical protein n=1 Tax=Arsenophonus endosymbiont of Aphis craccivora TaxID=1231049 RepID=UPI0015DDED1C|nr:hypothetical protein [Arsenophonus endosymbiont of Aphis craccivora]
MTWGPDVETNLAISSANHLKVRFIQQSHLELHLMNYCKPILIANQTNYLILVKCLSK